MLFRSGLEEKGYDPETGESIVEIDSRYFRPTEVETLLGSSEKARIELGWVPEISFEEMVKEMVISDLKAAKRDALIKKEGFEVFDYHE